MYNASMHEAGSDVLEGTVESVIYYDDEAHFAIIRFMPLDSLVPIVAKEIGRAHV